MLSRFAANPRWDQVKFLPAFTDALAVGRGPIQQFSGTTARSMRHDLHDTGCAKIIFGMPLNFMANPISDIYQPLA